MYQASAAVAVFRDKPNFFPDPSSLFSLLFWGGDRSERRRSLQGFIALIVRHIGRDELMRQQGGGFKWGGEGIFVLPRRRGTGVATYFFLYLSMPIALLGGIFVASSPIPRLCHQLWLPPYSAYCVSVLYTRGYTRHMQGGNGCLLFPRRPTCCFLRRWLPWD